MIGGFGLRDRISGRMGSLQIAVVGGGIGGFAAAGFLLRAGFNVTIYEQAAQLG